MTKKPTTKKPKAKPAAKPKTAKPGPKVAAAAATGVINEEDRALFNRHLPIIIAQRMKLNTANADLRNLYKKAKGDGFNKVDFEDAILMQTAEGEVKKRAAITRSLTIAQFIGADLGQQLDMFTQTIRVPAADRAALEGDTDALQGKSCKPGYAPDTEQARTYIKAWQDRQAKMIADGMKVLDPETGKEKPGLITKAQKDAADKAIADKSAQTGVDSVAPTSGVPITRAAFLQQQQAKTGDAKAAGEALFKKAAAPNTH